jgi:cytochrome c oxidase subunit 4
MSHSTTPTTHKRDPLRPESVGGPDQAPSHPHQQGPSLTMYLSVFAALMILLILTVWAAFLPHLGFLNIGIALAIATVKATLVILFFMHVIEASRLTKLFVAGAFIWLGIMFAFTFTDYLSRSWLPMSRGWNENPTVVRPTTAPAAGTPASPTTGPAAAAPAGHTAPVSPEK